MRASAAWAHTLDKVTTPSTVTKKASLLAGSRARFTSTSLKSHAGNVRPAAVTMRFSPMPTCRMGWLLSADHRRTVGLKSHGGESSSAGAGAVPSPANR